jgi:peptidoglycan/xylan/chitin deacetylase (PgdA/CDA1 family)
MSAKHRIKLFLRETLARVLWHTRLDALVDRVAPRRLVVLAGHCVSAPSNARLARDMKVGAADLEALLTRLGRRYELLGVGDGWRRIRERGSRSVVALSMDDGYRDNRTHLLDVLARTRAGATVYLESDPLDRRCVNWSHKFFWLLDALGASAFVERFAAECRDAPTAAALRALAAQGRATSYHLKRVLKYDAPAAERTRAIDALFASAGGDERALCDELYLTWDDARALAAAGVELGGHTVHHEILARLDASGAQSEVAGCRTALERALGRAPESFAYPFGRRWDYDERSKAAARSAGFATATTTHAGVNFATSDPFELKRLMIDADLRPHVIAAEACGAFELLRKVGLDLSE